jgi:DNA-binding NtrC family response regulator
MEENLILGNTAAMARLRSRAAEIASGCRPVHVVGEPGTGKSLIAATIHAASREASGPFVILDHFEPPEGESWRTHLDHVFASAEGGTLVFEHVERLPAALQEELRRSRRRRPCRLILTSRRPPEELVRSGLVLPRLLDRIDAEELNAPPLRHHRADIPELAMKFSQRWSRLAAEPAPAFQSEAMRLLQRLPLAGNGHELACIVDRACDEQDGGVLRRDAVAEVALAGSAAAYRQVLLLGHALCRGDCASVAFTLMVDLDAFRRHLGALAEAHIDGTDLFADGQRDAALEECRDTLTEIGMAAHRVCDGNAGLTARALNVEVGLLQPRVRAARRPS